MHTCSECGETFTRSDNLRRHQKNVCKVDFTRGPQEKRIKLDNTSPNMICPCCNVTLPKNRMTAHARTLQHRTNSSIPISDSVRLIKSAFRCRLASYRFNASAMYTDFKEFFHNIKQNALDVIEEKLRVHRALKVNMEVFGKYVLQTSDMADIKSFNTTNKVIDESMDLSDVYEEFTDELVSQSLEFEEKDSGWAIESILYAEVNINKFSPLGGSSYIKLPYFIEKKKAVVNVRNQDQCCFAWAVTSALLPVSTRVGEESSYPHFSTILNFDGMNFPVTLKDISLFEKVNNISINVYGIEKIIKDGNVTYEVVGPLRYTQRKLALHVNLLYLTDDKGNGHYCWIRDLSRLVSSQMSSNEHRRYFCDGCLLCFSTQTHLDDHQRNDCNHVFTVTPTKKLRIDKYGNEVPENILKFENFEKQMQVPFVVYADFESILKPIDSCESNPEHSYTNETHIHEPYSFSYLIKSSFDAEVSKFVLYRGKDAAKEFVTRLEADLREIYLKYLQHVVPMVPLTPEEQIEFDTATICNICEKPFSGGNVKVRDHCHITGKVRFGAAHPKCNLNFKLPNFIPIIMHNLSGYDCHLFIKQLSSHGDKVNVIAQNKEKYISFSKTLYMHNYVDKTGKIKKKFLQMRFIDSCRFLPGSLQTLSDSLTDEDFLESKKYFTDPRVFNLIRQKGVFPYNYIDDLKKLDQEYLPSKAQFYDKLNDKDISDQEYLQAVSVWRTFSCNNLGEYSDVYLKTDVLLLCDVFEKFRKNSINIYKLDPAHYYTSPGLSWDAMLKYTEIKLDLLIDINQINFFKKGIRGGISQCSGRMHEANNKYLPNYEPTKESTFISYLDATNLYGHAMSSPLPTGNFEWMNESEISTFNVENVKIDGDEGYVLEVDVQYPESLHDSHSDLPFLVECMIPPNAKTKIPKLIPNLYDKKKYIVHYRVLQQAIKYGLHLTKVHRILKFKQSFWLKKYIDLNTALRNKAKNKFERDFYKLFNNSIFGKTMENVDNRRDIKLVTHWENLRNSIGVGALIARPNFKSCSICHENLAAIHLEKVKVQYFKPIYVGFCILEISKIVMYDFFYGFLKKHYDDKVSMLYCDTDSQILKINTDDFYDFMKNNIGEFDTSNFSQNNEFNIPVNDSVLGKMKDEFPGDPIISFYGTGAKAYYIKSVQSEMKKAKGVKKAVIQNQLCGSDYKQIIESGGMIMRKMNNFRSKLHEVYTEVKNKIALAHHDDKRFLIPNTTKTLPWGHSDIQFYQTDPILNVKYAMGMGAINDIAKEHDS